MAEEKISVVALDRARRGSLIGLLLWPGALFYLAYTYVHYLVGAPFSALFLGYVAIVALSAYTTIGLVASIDRDTARQRLSGAVRPRLVGGDRAAADVGGQRGDPASEGEPGPLSRRRRQRRKAIRGLNQATHWALERDRRLCIPRTSTWSNRAVASHLATLAALGPGTRRGQLLEEIDRDVCGYGLGRPCGSL